MDCSSITNVTKPTDQTYSVGSVNLSLSLPTFIWTPSQATTSFTYNILSGPTFVTISGSPLQI